MPGARKISLLLLCTMLAGCSSTAARNTPTGADATRPYAAASLVPPDLPASPTAPPASGPLASLPLEQFGFTSDSDARILSSANGMLVAQCMTKEGFSYQENRPSAASSDTSDVVLVQEYGPTDLDWAAKNGYRRKDGTLNVQQMAGKVPVPSSSELLAQHGKAWMVALFGKNFAGDDPNDRGTDGCENTAANSLYDTAYRSTDRNLAASLAAEASTRTRADQRVIQVSAEWSSCMRGKGFSYTSPPEPATKSWPIPVGSLETATATADILCKQKTNLPAIWFTIEVGYQSELLQQHIVALKEFQAGYDRLIATATALLAAPAQPQGSPKS